MKRYLAFITFLVGGFLAGQALAQETDTTEVLGFDDIEEEAPPAAGIASWIDMIHISGRFDLNLEVESPAKEGDVRESRFRNYHKFLFLKVTPNDRLTLEAEVLDLSYYEVKYQLPNGLSVNFGKIWVPFGATPFHHHYGGRQGDPFQGLLLPNVWSEFGANLSGTLLNKGLFTVEADAYVIRGFQNELGSVLRFTNGGSDDIFAIGERTKIGIGTKFAVWGSVLYNRFGQDNDGQVLLWGGDLLADYGLVDLPVLRDLRLRAAFARAEVQDEALVSLRDSKDSWYYRYGDYAELSYRGFRYVIPRVRYGTIIDFDDRITNKDCHNWDLALLTRMGRHVMLLAQYQINLEEVNEFDNDLFRFQIVFEF